MMVRHPSIGDKRRAANVVGGPAGLAVLCARALRQAADRQPAARMSECSSAINAFSPYPVAAASKRNGRQRPVLFVRGAMFLNFDSPWLPCTTTAGRARASLCLSQPHNSLSVPRAFFSAASHCGQSS